MFLKKAIKNRKLSKANALDLVPVPLVSHEVLDNGNVSLLVKRFWFPFMNVLFKRSPFFHVRLDVIGSELWKKIDGKQTIQELVAQLPASEKLDERVVAFLTDLYRRDLLDFKNI